MKKTHKLLSLALSVIMVLSVLAVIPLSASAEEKTEGIFDYEVISGKARITCINDDYSGALAIPNTIGGYPVTSIGEYAFDSSSDITAIVIPDSVTVIEECAFSNCLSLTSVKIGKSVTSIGAWAFENCKSIESITIPSSVKTIDYYAFSLCAGLKRITIPTSVTTIGDEICFCCSELTDVYYTGTKAQKEKIKISRDYNEDLLYADWHYNCVPCKHTDTLVKNAKSATCTEEGYTGDRYCRACGEITSIGKTVAKLSHKASGWKVDKAAAIGVAGSKHKECTVCKKVLITAEIEALPIVKYTIKYKLDGGKAIKNPTTYTYFTSTITLKNPTKKGYKFVGWYNGSKKVTKIAKGSTGDVTLTAKWSKVTYKISYKLAGGKKVKNPATYTVTTSTIKLKNPTKKGYKFVGWYNGSKKVTEIKKGSTGDITLTAKWKVINYKITYKLGKGKNSSKNPNSYKVTTSTIKLKNPTRKGYTFKGWYNGKTKVTEIKKGSTGSITLTAKWAKKK